jgi:hypothetical protein
MARCYRNPVRATPFDDAAHRRELRRVTTLDVDEPAFVTSGA